MPGEQPWAIGRRPSIRGPIGPHIGVSQAQAPEEIRSRLAQSLGRNQNVHPLSISEAKGRELCTGGEGKRRDALCQAVAGDVGIGAEVSPYHSWHRRLPVDIVGPSHDVVLCQVAKGIRMRARTYSSRR